MHEEIEGILVPFRNASELQNYHPILKFLYRRQSGLEKIGRGEIGFSFVVTLNN